jgi:hypothetical protein
MSWIVVNIHRSGVLTMTMVYAALEAALPSATWVLPRRVPRRARLQPCPCGGT